MISAALKPGRKGLPLLVKTGTLIRLVEWSLVEFLVGGTSDSLQNQPSKEIETVCSHVNWVVLPKCQRMASELAPGAQDFAPREAVPEGEILHISVAGQDGRLDVLAV